MSNAATTSTTHALRLDHVSHSFGGKPALENLSLIAPLHQVTVLLGPNGAGKTTAIRCITGAIAPDAGNVVTLGCDPSDEAGHVRSRIGVLSAKPALYDRLSGYDNLVYAAELFGLEPRQTPDRIEFAAQMFGISSALSDLVGGYSTGMKTRLALARSILHDPELVLFDEPTSGLDPESSAAVLELIAAMPAAQRTVVMCTHLLSEAEGLADHVVMMDGGTQVCEGTPAGLTHRFFPRDIVTIEVELPEHLDALRHAQGVNDLCQTDATTVDVELRSFADTAGVVTYLVNHGAHITSVRQQRPTLERLYFAARSQSHPADLSAAILEEISLSSVATDEPTESHPESIRP